MSCASMARYSIEFECMRQSAVAGEVHLGWVIVQVLYLAVTNT